MISTRILDNDMGSVTKVTLTGIGTIHGIIIEIDKVKLPEFPMSLLEMLSSDMGITKVKDHCEEHLGNSSIETKFVECYTNWVKPIHTSGKGRY